MYSYYTVIVQLLFLFCLPVPAQGAAGRDRTAAIRVVTATAAQPAGDVESAESCDRVGGPGGGGSERGGRVSPCEPTA